MKKRISLSALFALFFFPFVQIAGEEPPPLREFCLVDARSIHDSLSPFVHQNVAIRGFLYQDAEGRHVLASKPDVPPCCVGQKHTQSQQMVVAGLDKLPPKKRVITVEGTVKPVETTDELGQPVTLFYLQDAHCKDLPHRHVWLTLSVISTVAILFFSLYARIRKPVPHKRKQLDDELPRETSFL